jgi:hypothetical protein
MGLFKGAKQDPGRRERLIRIRKTIESQFMYEEDAMSRPLNASTLKRLYNLDSLWVYEKGDVVRLGSANYAREIRLFIELKNRYGNLDSLVLDSGGLNYHIVEKGGRIYAFSTQMEVTGSDLGMMLREIEESIAPKSVFLTSDSNITVQ